MAAGRNKTALTSTVLIGGHFAPEVRSSLFLLQAQPENAGKNLKQLLGEAINDLCAKYGNAKRSPNVEVAADPIPLDKVDSVGEELSCVLLEPKACEICGKSFLRVIGEVGEKTCSGCEERLIIEKRDHETTLAAAKAWREPPKSDRTGKSKESFDPDLPANSLPPRRGNNRKVSRAGGRKHVTEVRHALRRAAAIADEVRVHA
jgi:hypothetical protein